MVRAGAEAIADAEADAAAHEASVREEAAADTATAIEAIDSRVREALRPLRQQAEVARRTLDDVRQQRTDQQLLVAELGAKVASLEGRLAHTKGDLGLAAALVDRLDPAAAADALHADVCRRLGLTDSQGDRLRHAESF